MTNSAQEVLASSGVARDYFDSVASFWEGIYGRTDVYSVVHRHRQNMALALFDKAPIPPGSRVLEIGCGAGFTSIQIAVRGHSVTAVDFAHHMLDMTGRNARNAGFSAQIQTGQCDAQWLPFRTASFDAVMALGVLPWLPAMQPALNEMARVLKPGGCLIVNMDNRWRLTHVADPSSWIRPALTRLAARIGLCQPYNAPRTIVCSVPEFDRALSGAGLRSLSGTTLGFGPFWLLNKLLPPRWGVALNNALQRLADRGVPFIRSAGMQYLTLSRKQAGNG